jgi:hypothetical protein
LLLANAACIPPEPEPDGFSHLHARFLYEGQPHGATLTVSDGDFHERWENTTEIDARIPSTATWIIDAKAPGDTSVLPVTFRDLIPELRIAVGDTLDIVIHLLRPGTPRSFDPVVLIEQAEAAVAVDNRVERDPARPGWRRLVSTVEGDPGAFVMLDGVYRDPDVSPDSMRAFTCGDGCPHIFAAVDCSVYCFGCSSTCTYEGYWKGNVNMCSLTAVPGTMPTSEFEELRANTGGVQLAAILRRDGLVLPVRAERVSIRPTTPWSSGRRGSPSTRAPEPCAFWDAAGQEVGRIPGQFRLGGGEVSVLHEGIGTTAQRQRLIARCPGPVWIAGDVSRAD